MSDGERKTLRAKAPTREQIAQLDWEDLVLNQKFLRILFTILSTAGMFSGNYQSEGRNLAFAEGRRSLGLDILRTAEKYLGPDALLRILEAERSTPKEAPNGSGTDYTEQRDDELGSPSDERPVAGARYLDYGPVRN